MHLVSSKSFLYALIFGRNIHKGLFFTIFVANEIFQSFFTKRDLIRYYYFIIIYNFYLNRSFTLVKCLSLDFNIAEFYNCFFFPFLNMLSKIFIYFLTGNFPPFLYCSDFFSQISILR